MLNFILNGDWSNSVPGSKFQRGWRWPTVTWKQLPSLALGNDFLETNAGELPEVKATAGGCSDCWKIRQLLEAAATVWSCGDCWKLRWVAGEARNMMENALSIVIVIFSLQLQQTETSDRKLFKKNCVAPPVSKERYHYYTLILLHSIKEVWEQYYTLHSPCFIFLRYLSVCLSTTFFSSLCTAAAKRRPPLFTSDS